MTHGSDAPPATATIATSASAALLFELTDHPEGIHVTRVLRRDDGDKVYCSALLGDERMFLDWLDADALRYAHPLVFQQARRCFAQLMAQRVHHDPVLG